ncbi:MAG: TRAP transporter fused permease subunit [Trueperaceae bacterium]|nr:TRAP transporter fused permease subunit [Trueperaceae bacterium]
MSEATKAPAPRPAPSAAAEVEALKGEALAADDRHLQGMWRVVFELMAGGMALYYLYSAGFGSQRAEWHLGVYVMLTFAMVFLNFSWRPGRAKTRPNPVDLVLALASIGVAGYFMHQYEAIAYRIGRETQLDYAVASIAVLLSFEVGRRTLGWALPIIALALMAYAYYGPYMPDLIAHRGYTLRRIVNYAYLTPEGIFGLMANVLATYVIVFIFFGAFLNRSGVGAFFIDLALAVSGRAVGGPAKVSVLASALMGSISGSAIANTVSTGALTIPLMKRTGFRPETAGAVEASASIGGMFLPPVMGAGAFVMVELTGIPYLTIMLVSIVPALLYMLSVWVAVHFHAKSLGLKGLPAAEIPGLGKVLRERWFFALPLALVVTLLVLGYSPGFAAFWGTVATVPTSWLRRETRMGPAAVWRALVDGGRQTLVVGTTVGLIGIMLGMISLTGLALKFTTVFLSLSSGSVLLAILLVALASLVLGMGMPVTASYLVVAVLAGPALVELGIALLAAHMIIYWLSQDSNITPPVCVSAYAAAAIANADPWRTGWASFKYAKMLYVMPLLFAFTPILFTTGTWDHVLVTWFSATLGTIAFGALTVGYLRRSTTVLEWAGLAIATFLCYHPTLWSDAVGVGLVAALWVFQRRFELTFRHGLRRLDGGT